MSKYKVGDKVLVEGVVVETDNSQRVNTRIVFRDNTDEWFNEQLLFDASKTYEDGLQDAWELARKIVLAESKGGIPERDMSSIFGEEWTLSNILKNYTPQEALAKIEAYVESKAIKAIKVGDVVVMRGIEVIVTYIHTNNTADVLLDNGYTGKYEPINQLKKTGRHIDISHLLEQIRGNE